MIGVVCAIAILSAGCKSKESEAPTPSSTQDVPAETAETEYQPEPVETHEGEVRSFYTGEWMDEKKAKNRPVAVMTENTHVTLPQYGIVLCFCSFLCFLRISINTRCVSTS